MRAYTVATVAVALGVSTKWLDNVLSHQSVPGVTQSRQGVSRRLTQEAVVVLAVALSLIESLRLPVHAALAVAGRLCKSGGSESGHELARGGRLVFDIRALEDEVSAELARAAEFAPSPRRGRPPR